NAKPGTEAWQLVQSFGTFAKPVVFSPDEMGLVLRLQGHAVFNQLANLDAVHTALIDALKLMASQPTDLTQRLQTEKTAHGKLLENVDQQAYLALSARMTSVNDLIVWIRQEAKEDTDLSLQALRDVHSFLAARLELTYPLDTRIFTPNGL